MTYSELFQYYNYANVIHKTKYVAVNSLSNKVVNADDVKDLQLLSISLLDETIDSILFSDIKSLLNNINQYLALFANKEMLDVNEIMDIYIIIIVLNIIFDFILMEDFKNYCDSHGYIFSNDQLRFILSGVEEMNLHIGNINQQMLIEHNLITNDIVQKYCTIDDINKKFEN